MGLSSLGEGRVEKEGQGLMERDKAPPVCQDEERGSEGVDPTPYTKTDAPHTSLSFSQASYPSLGERICWPRGRRVCGRAKKGGSTCGGVDEV